MLPDRPILLKLPLLTLMMPLSRRSMLAMDRLGYWNLKNTRLRLFMATNFLWSRTMCLIISKIMWIIWDPSLFKILISNEPIASCLPPRKIIKRMIPKRWQLHSSLARAAASLWDPASVINRGRILLLSLLLYIKVSTSWPC